MSFTRQPIGGYFEMELPDRGGFLHDEGVLLNSGRNALEYVLRSLPGIEHLWIPYYTCSVVLEPVIGLGIAYTFYQINEKLEIKDSIDLQAGDYLLYTDYFGIKDLYVQQLANRFGARLIVDNAQAWFAEPIPGVSTIYSPRKYFGVPDGGIAFCSNGIDVEQFEQGQSFDRCSHLLKRIDIGPTGGYPDFKENDQTLAIQPIRRMSKLTERVLRSIDFESVKQKRMKNYIYLNERLGSDNLLSIPEHSSFACPMVYPFWADKGDLKIRLIENGIYVATYWPNVLEWTDGWELSLAQDLVCLPVDQRYGELEMNEVIDLIKH